MILNEFFFESYNMNIDEIFIGNILEIDTKIFRKRRIRISTHYNLFSILNRCVFIRFDFHHILEEFENLIVAGFSFQKLCYFIYLNIKFMYVKEEIKGACVCVFLMYIFKISLYESLHIFFT